jgi:hypothetical protein
MTDPKVTWLNRLLLAAALAAVVMFLAGWGDFAVRVIRKVWADG